MNEWKPLRVTMSIYEVEGDNQYFDPGRYTATVKLNSGANIQLDLADPENSGSLFLKDQFDTLRISLKEKSTGAGYGSVSFDAEIFKEHPVIKQWISLHSSALSDAFKGEIGRDERTTPRLYLAYDSIPQVEGESRGRTTAKRTKETLQLDRGSHDSRRKRSARGNQKSGKLVVKQNKSRVVTQRGIGSTKTTKVEKQFSGSAKGSQLGGSLRGSASRVSGAADSLRNPRKKQGISDSRRENFNSSGRNEFNSSSRRDDRFGSAGREEHVVTSTSKIQNLGASGSGSTSNRRVTQRTSLNFNSSGRSPKSVAGGLEHDDVEREISSKTRALADELVREKAQLKEEENKLIGRLKVFDTSNAKLERDERELSILKSKAEKDLQSIRNEATVIQREEERSQQDLIRQLEQLEQEHLDIEAQLEQEQVLASNATGRSVTIGGVDSREVDEINNLKNEAQMVLDEIKEAVRTNQIPMEESSFDPLFREDLERHANDILDKERERYNMEVEGMGISEASLNYQRSQKDSLQKEYNRVTTMYDDLGNDIDRELQEEAQELEQLKDYYRQLEEDRDHFRFTIDSLKNDQSMTYSLDAGSGPVNKFGRSLASNAFGAGGQDEHIRVKLQKVEEAEKNRREAEIQLDKLYDQWRSRIDRELDSAYVKATTDNDRVGRQEIITLMVDNDKTTRSLNALLADKERLENLLYLRKTNHRMTSVVSLDSKSLTSRINSIKKEDRELMDELNKSDNALLAKNTALRELDDKIRVLSRKYADLEAEAQEKKGLISSLRVKHDQIRLEIERLRGLLNEDELARLEAEIRAKENRLRDLQAEVDELELIVVEWREKIILKQRLVKSRTQSRVLLFEPDPNDPVDQYLADYVLSHVTTVPVKKIGRNKYLFGTRNIDIVRDSHGDIKVKMLNGELWTLEQFINQYHDKELQKLDVLGDNEELVVDEKDDYKYQENVRLHGQNMGTPISHYESHDQSRFGETFNGYDDYRETELRNTRKTRQRRQF